MKAATVVNSVLGFDSVDALTIALKTPDAKEGALDMLRGMVGQTFFRTIDISHTGELCTLAKVWIVGHML